MKRKEGGAQVATNPSNPGGEGHCLYLRLSWRRQRPSYQRCSKLPKRSLRSSSMQMSMSLTPMKMALLEKMVWCRTPSKPWGSARCSWMKNWLRKLKWKSRNGSKMEKEKGRKDRREGEKAMVEEDIKTLTTTTNSIVFLFKIIKSANKNVSNWDNKKWLKCMFYTKQSNNRIYWIVHV